jgi:hypothetical protein
LPSSWDSNSLLSPNLTLPGGEPYRQYWSRYYDGAQALIFVIDAAAGLAPGLEALREALSDPRLKSVPLLVLLHKSDKPNTSVAFQ